MSGLYEIQQQIEQSLEALALAEEEGTLSSEDQTVAGQWLDGLAAAEQETIDGVGRALRKAKAEFEHLEAEARLLAGKAQSRKNAYERYRQYIVEVLQASGLKNIKGLETTLYQHKTDFIHIDEGFNLYNLPPECLEIVPKARKSELKKLIKAGQSFAGVSLVEKISLGMR